MMGFSLQTFLRSLDTAEKNNRSLGDRAADAETAEIIASLGGLCADAPKHVVGKYSHRLSILKRKKQKETNK